MKQIDFQSLPSPPDQLPWAVPAGARREVQINLPTDAAGIGASMPLVVIRGHQPGPSIWVSAALHGDELNGIAIVHELLRQLDETQLRGTVLAVPVVNVFGFARGSRYLPDRRDLNRCFPGSKRGSVGSRVARLFLKKVVRFAQVGIDLHTASDGRTNLPQIRTNLDDPMCRSLALAFGSDVVLHAPQREGSLRAAASNLGKPALLFEGGAALELDPIVVEHGVRGVIGVLSTLGMLDDARRADESSPRRVRELERSHWYRAEASGILTLTAKLGAVVKTGAALGHICDLFGHRRHEIRASCDGIVIGSRRDPAVQVGDAVVHLGREYSAEATA